VTTVSLPHLRAIMTRRALGLGFNDAEAALLVDHFVDAEMRGAEGHGVERLRWLAGRPALEPRTQLALTSRDEGLVRYDARGSLGYTALAAAIDAEIANPPAGARVIVVGNCFPTGRLGYFAERAARRGLVCLLTATSTARISHPTGGGPLLGTNPLCLALPGNPDPAVIDVSMGRVTYGAVLKAIATGSPLPVGAAVTTDGRPTTDPNAIEADTAGVMPFGDDQSYKGFALALLVEVLCRSLAGEHGHAAVALLAAPVAAPMEAINAAVGERRMPGEHSTQRHHAARQRGELELPDDLWRWLEAV
jgi:LDH2 family malate/lactate/ureidoglycolate dehydrogenase